MAESDTDGADLSSVPATAAREYLLSGKPLTRMEAIVLFGLSNLPELVYEMRRQKIRVETRKVPYATAMVRINQQGAMLKPPPNLPIREIAFTEYRVST